MKQWLDKQFKLSEFHSNVRTELLAGLTTFVTMAYVSGNSAQHDGVRRAGQARNVHCADLAGHPHNLRNGVFIQTAPLHWRRDLAV